MSKDTHIQAALKEIGPAAFQRLCDAFLYASGYRNINQIGLVIGADKVKQGTPDSLVVLPNGKYVFAEYTTQQSDVCGKLLADLQKCFDEAKTGIPVKDIEEVVLCYNSELSSQEEQALLTFCKEKGVKLNRFGMGSLSLALHLSFPLLTKEFLGIEVDTGQFLSAEDFVAHYNSGRLATPLDTAFQHRTTELEQALEALETVSVLLLTGRPGVGKSRLGLEVCSRFVQKHPQYKGVYLFNKGVDIYEDLRTHLTPPGDYVLFVDDANRLAQLEYILHEVRRPKEKVQLKVVLTVRDYAGARVREAIREHAHVHELEIGRFTDEEIGQFLTTSFGIRNDHYLERIASVAEGNPRIAAMTAQIAVKENSLDSISDISSVYESYFESVKKDLEDIKDRNLLKIGGIISFFTTLDTTNQALVEAITNAFGVTPEQLRSGVERLYQIEAVDIHENEVARVSDQILSTYLFYQAFFVSKVLSFSTLLRHFSEKFLGRIIESLNSVVSAFDNDSIQSVIKPAVDAHWEELRDNNAQEQLLNFAKVFWGLKQTETLILAREYIEALEPQALEPEQIRYHTNSNIGTQPIIELLAHFSNAQEHTITIAVELLLDYARRRPSETAHVVYALKKSFGPQHDSHRTGFVAEKAMLQTIAALTQDFTHPFYTRIYLAVAPLYLGFEFSSSISRRRHTVEVRTFYFGARNDWIAVRTSVWRSLTEICARTEFKKIVLDVLRTYPSHGSREGREEIVAKDAPEILALIAQRLDPKELYDCYIARELLHTLDSSHVSYPSSILRRFNTKKYQTAALFLERTDERYILGWEEYTQQRRQKIREHVAIFKLGGYKIFLDECLLIQELIIIEHELYRFHHEIKMVLVELADKDTPLFKKVITHYLLGGNRLNLDAEMVPTLIRVYGRDEAYTLLSTGTFAQQLNWLFCFFRFFADHDLTPAEYLDNIYTLYEEAAPEEMPRDMEYLSGYTRFDDQVFTKVLAIIVQKARTNPYYAWKLETLFNSYSPMSNRLVELFGHDKELIKEAYLLFEQVDQHADYEAKGLNALFDIDPAFLEEYVDSKLGLERGTISYRPERHYGSLWLREDYADIMTRMLMRIFSHYTNRYSYTNFTRSLFILSSDEARTDVIIARQDELLRNLLATHAQNKEYIQYLFEIISELGDERKVMFVEWFLRHNRDVELFRQLQLEPSGGYSWTGSAVPVWQRVKDFYTSLLPLLTTAELLMHRQYVETQIQRLVVRIEGEKRNDFMRL